MNSGKEIFFQNINDAFATGDAKYLEQYLAEDVTWNMVGDRILQGKEEFLKTFSGTGILPKNMVVNNIIAHEIAAAVEGTFEWENENGNSVTYAFCDIYKLDGLDETSKIKEITSYVIAIKQ